MAKLTLFHCTHAIDGVPDPVTDAAEVRVVELPCSSMIKDFILLRAFEAGSDAVVILACPEGQCRHTDGNIRARKRVEQVKMILNSIGLDGRRLLFFNSLPGGDSVTKMIEQALSELEELGPSPITSAITTQIK